MDPKVFIDVFHPRQVMICPTWGLIRSYCTCTGELQATRNSKTLGKETDYSIVLYPPVKRILWYAVDMNIMTRPSIASFAQRATAALGREVRGGIQEHSHDPSTAYCTRTCPLPALLLARDARSDGSVIFGTCLFEQRYSFVDRCII